MFGLSLVEAGEDVVFLMRDGTPIATLSVPEAWAFHAAAGWARHGVLFCRPLVQGQC